MPIEGYEVSAKVKLYNIEQSVSTKKKLIFCYLFRAYTFFYFPPLELIILYLHILSLFHPFKP